MVVNDIKDIHDLNGHIRYLVLQDRKASLIDVDKLLERLTTVDDLRIETQLSTLPNHLDRLQVQSLTIKAPQVDFKLKNLNLPSGLESFSLTVDSLDKIPDRLWSISRLQIQANHLGCQDFDTAVGHIGLNYSLDIGDLRILPSIQANSIRVKSTMLEMVSSSLFDLNSESLTELNIICSAFAESMADAKRLNALQFCSIQIDHHVDGKSLDFLPDTLKRLSISAAEIIDFDLSRFDRIENISLDGLQLIALSLDSTPLRNLSISNSTVNDFSNCRAPNLKILSLTNSLSAVPEFIFDCIQLQRLTLLDNDINSIPRDWSTLKSLQFLFLNDNNIYFDNLNFLGGLDSLKQVTLFNNRFRDKYIFLTKKWYPISNYGLSGVLQCETPRIDAVLKFATAVAKSKMEESMKRMFFDAYIQNPDLRLFLFESKEHFISAFRINYRPLKLVINSYVDELIRQKSGMASLKGAKVFVDGKTKLSSSQLKTILTDSGSIVHRKWSDDITHILLGDKPCEARSFEEGLLYLAESDIASLSDSEKFINVQVESGKTELVDKLKLLLLSPDSANVNIGMKMLETGGVNSNFISVLLAIAKSNNDAKIRKDAKRLLELYGPKEWISLLSNKLLFKNLNGKVREQEINIKLAKIGKEVGIDLACELSLALYERFQKGLRFMVSRSKYSLEYAQRMYDLICIDGHLSLDIAMGFKNWKSTDPSEIIFNSLKTKFPIPIRIVDYKKVESIGLHNTKLTTIPKDISKFKEVKRIDFSCNNITKLPVFLSKMTSIEELDLSFNLFDEFPMYLVDMKNIKKVDFRNNRTAGSVGEFCPIEVPPEVKAKMPECVFYC